MCVKEIFIFIGTSRKIFFSEKCTSGFYGHNCLGECAHCLGTSACDPVDGRCTNGCEPGWQTDKCDISEQHCICIIFFNISQRLIIKLNVYQIAK